MIGDLIKIKKEKVKSEIKMKKLAKEIERDLSGRAEIQNTKERYTAWVNNKLGKIDNIRSFNKWYGKDFSKKTPKKNDVLLLFPNSVAFYNEKIKTRDDLDNIILNKENWEALELTPKNFLLDKNDNVESSIDYFDYLVDKGKTKEDDLDKSTKIKKAIKNIKNNENMSLISKVRSAHDAINKINKDIESLSLDAELTALQEKLGTVNGTETAIHVSNGDDIIFCYNEKIISGSESNTLPQNLENCPYWCGDTSFLQDNESKQKGVLLLFPSTETLSKKISLKKLRREILNEKNWTRSFTHRGTQEAGRLKRLNKQNQFEKLSEYISTMEKLMKEKKNSARKRKSQDSRQETKQIQNSNKTKQGETETNDNPNTKTSVFSKIKKGLPKIKKVFTRKEKELYETPGTGDQVLSLLQKRLLSSSKNKVKSDDGSWQYKETDKIYFYTNKQLVISVDNHKSFMNSFYYGNAKIVINNESPQKEAILLFPTTEFPWLKEKLPAPEDINKVILSTNNWVEHSLPRSMFVSGKLPNIDSQKELKSYSDFTKAWTQKLEDAKKQAEEEKQQKSNLEIQLPKLLQQLRSTLEEPENTSKHNEILRSFFYPRLLCGYYNAARKGDYMWYADENFTNDMLIFNGESYEHSFLTSSGKKKQMDRAKSREHVILVLPKDEKSLKNLNSSYTKKELREALGDPKTWAEEETTITQYPSVAAYANKDYRLNNLDEYVKMVFPK